MLLWAPTMDLATMIQLKNGSSARAGDPAVCQQIGLIHVKTGTPDGSIRKNSLKTEPIPMKLYPFIAILSLFLVLMSCEPIEEEESICLPVNMSITLVQGSNTSKIIADFHYIPETEQLDHITWSNHQTHYFEYDDSQRILVVRVMKVDAKVQEERWFVYDGTLVARVDRVKRNLHYTTLEPLDSAYTGYVEFEYEGENIIEESEYEISEDGYREDYIRNVSYEYDSKGNLMTSTSLDPKSGETQHRNMSYDQSKHPFSALQYYFSGESFVNNMLSRSEEEAELDYTYVLTLNDLEYPEIIHEKLGSAYTRIINYSYLVQ